MSHQAIPISGYQIYRYYSEKVAYYRNIRRRRRDLRMIEKRFGDVLGLDTTKTAVKDRHYLILRAFNDLLTRLHLEPESLERLHEVLGQSLNKVKILALNGFSFDEDVNITLFYILVDTLSKLIEQRQNLQEDLNKIDERNLILADYIEFLERENLDLRLERSDLQQESIQNIISTSLSYEHLLESNTNLQHETYASQLNLLVLIQKLFKTESNLAMQHLFNGTYPPKFDTTPIIDFDDTVGVTCESPRLTGNFSHFNIDNDLELLRINNTPTFGHSSPMASLGNDKGNVSDSGLYNSTNCTSSITANNDYSTFDLSMEDPIVLHAKLDEYKRENEFLRAELSRLSDRTEVNKMAVTTQRISNIIEELVMNGGLFDNQPCLLLVENEFYKSLYNEVYKELSLEVMKRYELQIDMVRLKMELYNAQQVFYKLENQSVLFLNNEEELKLLKSNTEVYTNQVLGLQNAAIELNEEKHDLQLKVETLDSINATALKECDILREENRNLEKLLMESDYNFQNNSGIRDKVRSIRLEGDCKLLQDKLARSANNVKCLHDKNLQLIASITELRSSVEHLRHENTHISKQLSANTELRSALQSQIESLTGQVKSLKSSLEKNNEILSCIRDELDSANGRIVQQDLKAHKLNEVVEAFKKQIKDVEIKDHPVLKGYMKLLTTLKGTLSYNTPGSNQPNDTFDTLYTILTTIFKCNNILVNLTTHYIEEYDEEKDLFLDAMQDDPSAGSYSTHISGNLKVSDVSTGGSHTESRPVREDTISRQNGINSLEIDELRLSYTSKIDALMKRIRAFESLDKQSLLDEISSAYRNMVEKYKFELDETTKLLQVNESSLSLLKDENVKLLSDCTRAANAILDFDHRINEYINERIRLKGLINSILPQSVRETCDLNDPINALQALEAALRAERKLGTKVLVDKKDDAYDNSSMSIHSPSQTQELISNIFYYYKTIREHIEDQLKNVDTGIDYDTDYESPRDLTARSQDTIDDEDEHLMMSMDELNEKYVKYFELILNLLDKLRYNIDLNKASMDVKKTQSSCFSTGDLTIIRHISDMCKVLKGIFADTPKQLELDELLYKMESIPTSIESDDKKNQHWTKCLTSIISMVTDALNHGIKEQGSTLDEAIMRLKVTRASLEEAQEVNKLQNQELERRKDEITQLDKQVNELQLYCKKLENQLDSAQYKYPNTTSLRTLEKDNAEKQTAINSYIRKIDKLEKLVLELEEVNLLLNKELNKQRR